MMGIVDLSIKHPVTTWMCILLVILLGVVSLTMIPLDLLPDINLPMAAVITSYNGAGPEEVESMVTKNLESVLASVNNVDSIQSISQENTSMIIVNFNVGTDLDDATAQMREKLDMIKGMLPSDVDTPIVMKIDPSMMPVMIMSVSGNMDNVALKDRTENDIKPALEKVAGVASVTVSGGRTRQINVELNQDKLNALGLSTGQIVNALRAQNMNLPGGTIKSSNQEITVRTVGEFTSVEQIKNTPVILPTGGIVFLKDLGEVVDGYADVSSITYLNGKPGMGIIVQKASDANTVTVARNINEALKNIERDYPDIKITKIIDSSEFINRSISNVEKNAVVGAILAVLILYLFLRNVRTTLIIAISIPVSIVATFVMMYFSGMTLNLISLGGLALGVGMLVDNSIVVLENVFRYRQEGHDRYESASTGAKEVGMAIVGSTLTTVAVFLPIVFMQGITSQIFRDLALTVSFSLMASLVVALTVVPMLSYQLISVETHEPRVKGILYRLSHWVGMIFERLSAGYSSLLRISLRHRLVTLLIGIAVFAVSMLSVSMVGTELIPQMDQGQFSISASLPKGTNIETTDKVMQEIYDRIKDIPEIDVTYLSIGSTGVTNMALGGSTNEGSFNIKLKPLSERKRSTDEVAEEVRQRLSSMPGVKITVSTGMTAAAGSKVASTAGSILGTSVSLDIKGDDMEVLRELSDQVAERVKDIPGTRDVQTSFSEGEPEYIVKLKNDAASSYGLTTAQVAQAVQASVNGTTATRYKLGGEDIDVVVRLAGGERNSIEDLKSLYIQTPIGVQVPLSAVTDVSIGVGPSEIDRQDQSRVAHVTAAVVGRDQGSVNSDLEKAIKEIPVPNGYSVEMGSSATQLNDAFSSLGRSLILAVILVYMIMASQFESLLHPFTILMSVPISLSTGILGLVVTGKALSIPAYIGLIMLAGIVVNNGIVLIDYINTLRRRDGMERNEAITKGGPTRLRPILMTTLTTVVGLIPLALGIGEGAEMEQPLAITVIFGLTFSTLVTLIILPVIYSYFDDAERYVSRLLHRNEARGEL
ncbi:MAG: efflux RND transporter permease subunit [Thermoanaerobacteraceae bacterium]|nr:efflux RND transporter permease subunit [Thermoanaerobacteraceae bacterium]